MAQQKITLDLWPNGAPDSNGLKGPESGNPNNVIGNVSHPTITVFVPVNANGKAVLICPGGGYVALAMNHEGNAFGPWLNEQGIAAIVLKYRMPNGHPTIPGEDVEQAMRMIRLHATEWKIDPNKIGVMGFSAGGHLAATLATRFHADTRPAFQVLFYPVITMDAGYTHGGSRRELIGTNPSAETVKAWSNELQVKGNTPPAFIALSNDDDAVVPTNSINYYLALNRHHIPAELHVYPTGGHGWGFHDDFIYKQEWTASLKRWLSKI